MACSPPEECCLIGVINWEGLCEARVLSQLGYSRSLGLELPALVFPKDEAKQKTRRDATHGLQFYSLDQALRRLPFLWNILYDLFMGST